MENTFFKSLGFRVITDCFEDGTEQCEATVKSQAPDGTIEHTAANGVGPVDALYMALLKALKKFYPKLDKVQVVDFRLETLDPEKGTAATVKVSVISTDGEDMWTMDGASSNMNKASYLALIGSFLCKLSKDEARKAQKSEQ